MKMSKRLEKDQQENQGERQFRLNRVIGICLAYLLIVLFVLVPTTLSSYVSTTGGSDTARVARMSLDAEIEFSVHAIKPGETITIDFELSGENSDVTQAYSIAMNCTANLPLDYALTCTANGGTPILLEKMLPQTTYSGGTLLHGETHAYSLVVSWDETKTDHQYSDEIEYITITTQSVQVD